MNEKEINLKGIKEYLDKDGAVQFAFWGVVLIVGIYVAGYVLIGFITFNPLWSELSSFLFFLRVAIAIGVLLGLAAYGDYCTKKNK